MKKLFFLFLITTYNIVSSQEGIILPLSEYTDNNSIDGTYYADSENLFLPYIGTWQAVWNNKIFLLTIQKVTRNKELFPDVSYWYEDRLIGKYKILNASTGNVMQETPSLYSVNNAKLTNAGVGKNNKLIMGYFDLNICNISGQVWLERNLINSNQLQYFFIKGDFSLDENCPYNSYDEIPIPIPTLHLILNKVN